MAEARINASDAAAPPNSKRRFPYLALAAWILFALVVPWLVQSLNVVDVLEFPLGYFMAAQGSFISLLLVAVLSARRRDRAGTAEDA